MGDCCYAIVASENALFIKQFYIQCLPPKAHSCARVVRGKPKLLKTYFEVFSDGALTLNFHPNF